MSPTAAARIEWQLVTTASRATAHRPHDQQGAAATKITSATTNHGHSWPCALRALRSHALLVAEHVDVNIVLKCFITRIQVDVKLKSFSST